MGVTFETVENAIVAPRPPSIRLIFNGPSYRVVYLEENKKSTAYIHLVRRIRITMVSPGT